MKSILDKEIDTVFNHEIDIIYLNFSDPWPKDRHAKRRLTSPIFLDIYDKLIKYILKFYKAKYYNIIH